MGVQPEGLADDSRRSRGRGGATSGKRRLEWDAPQRGASVPGADEPASGNDGASNGPGDGFAQCGAGRRVLAPLWGARVSCDRGPVVGPCCPNRPPATLCQPCGLKLLAWERGARRLRREASEKKQAIGVQPGGLADDSRRSRGRGGRPPGSGGRGGMHPRGVPACRVRMSPRPVMTEPPMGRAMILLNVGLVEEFWHPFGVRGFRAIGVRWSVPVARTDHRLPSVSPAG